MKSHWTNLQSCISMFAFFSVLLGGTSALPSPDPYAHANPTGGSHRYPYRRFPSLPVDMFRTRSGELQQVEWDSDAFTTLILARNPGTSIPREVFLVDNVVRDVDDETSEAIFITDVVGHDDDGTLFRLEPRRKKKTKKQQEEEEEDVEYRLVAEKHYDMSGKNLIMQRSFVGILWTPKARTAFVKLMKEMVPMGSKGAETAGGEDEEGGESERVVENGEGSANGGEEEDELTDGASDGGESLLEGDERFSWGYSVVTGGVKEGFIDPGQEYSYFREPMTPVYY